MSNEHDTTKGKKFLGMMRGVVVDNLDPDKSGRCRITIPGIYPLDGGPWAWQIGTAGGGTKERGRYHVPDIGADVAVWFEQGDPDAPAYVGGNYGTEEVPPEVSDPENDEEQATKVAVWETERWRVKLDGRYGKSEAHILDKVTQDVVELDGVAAGIRIRATGVLQLESVTEVAIVCAGSITIGGRTVVKNGKPIQ